MIAVNKANKRRRNPLPFTLFETGCVGEHAVFTQGVKHPLHRRPFGIIQGFLFELLKGNVMSGPKQEHAQHRRTAVDPGALKYDTFGIQVRKMFQISPDTEKCVRLVKCSV